MKKEICFDMDGTIADLYGVSDWLACLIDEDESVYREAMPLLNMALFARLLNSLQRKGYALHIISWLSKSGSDDFMEAITEAKLDWLAEHLPSVHFDLIDIVPYGTPKQSIGMGILFDDEEKNRDNWEGIAYDEKNILEILKAL